MKTFSLNLKKMNKKWIWIAVAILVLIAIVGGIWWWRSTSKVKKDTNSNNGKKVLGARKRGVNSNRGRYNVVYAGKEDDL